MSQRTVVSGFRLGLPRGHQSEAIILLALGLGFLLLGLGPWRQVLAALLGERDQYWIGQDFTAFYAAGKMVISGQASQIYDLNAIATVERAAAGHAVGDSGILPYFNPPFFALAFAPLTTFGLGVAYGIWTVLNGGLLALNCWLLWRIADSLPRRWRVALVAGYVTLYPVTFGLRIGQFSLLLQTAWAGGYLALRSGRDRWAGVALSLLLVKPELLVLVAAFMVWKRRWRVFSTLASLAAAATAASVLLIGGAAAVGYPSYLMRAATQATAGVGTRLMFNWTGIVGVITARPDPSPLTFVATAVLSILTVYVVVRLWRGPYAPASARFPRQWLALTCATILIDPHLYLQDTVLLVPAVVAVVAQLPDRQRRPAAAVAAAGWFALNSLGLAVAVALGGGVGTAFGLPLSPL